MNWESIKAARAGLSWTQARLAREAGLHTKAVAYWESPCRKYSKIPSPGLKRIVDALDRAGLKQIRDNPRNAMLTAFDNLTPEQQLQAALKVTGILKSEKIRT